MGVIYTDFDTANAGKNTDESHYRWFVVSSGPELPFVEMKIFHNSYNFINTIEKLFEF